MGSWEPVCQCTLRSGSGRQEGIGRLDRLDDVSPTVAGSIRLPKSLSRYHQRRDHTRRFPELVEAIRALRFRTLVLDGEVAVYDEQLISRFEWLRQRPTDRVATPPHVHGVRLSPAR